MIGSSLHTWLREALHCSHFVAIGLTVLVHALALVGWALLLSLTALAAYVVTILP